MEIITIIDVYYKAGDGGAVVEVSLSSLKHHVSSSRWGNQSFYDSLDDKLVRLRAMDLNPH